MTFYQIWTRTKHFFCAKHWRGAAIHSPMMYAFVRHWALKYKGRKMIEALGANVVDDVEDISKYENHEIIILREPFKNKQQYTQFKKWYAENHVVTAHFQGLIVIFFDKKLQKQSYVIRN